LTCHRHCCDDVEAEPNMVLMNPFISLLKVLNCFWFLHHHGF
jgi:hypothetical protein